MLTGGLDGRSFARGYHAEVVGPILARELPGLRYAAGRLGSGSDVLGFDDATSRDHDWGCRLVVLVDEQDHAAVRVADAVLARELPDTYRGHPVRFPTSWAPQARHQVWVDTVHAFAAGRLGVGVPDLSTVDWLVLTGQSVLEVTAGPVFVDGTRELSRVRELLRWYPPDLDRYVLAAGWGRIAERMALHGRTGQTGAEPGSRRLAAALTGDLIRQAFLVHRRWAPYDKWLDAAFADLPGAADLAGPLAVAAGGGDWRAREEGVAAAAELLLAAQRERGLPGPPSAVGPFFDRPYRSIAPTVAESLLAGVTDPVLTRLPAGLGSVEQWVGGVGWLAKPEQRAGLVAAYRQWLL